MPEIPEMEIYRHNLNRWVVDKDIKEVKVFRAKSLNIGEELFVKKVRAKTVQAVNRKGKFLYFKLGEDSYLLTHMMLDGRLYYLPQDLAVGLDLNLEPKEIKKQVEGLPGRPSVVFTFSDNSLLFFCSLTLGYLHYLNQEELQAELNKVGIDPLEEELDAESFKKLLGGKRGMIKPWLMNQKYLAGIGNAYSNDSLFEAGILPQRQISNIEELEKEKLYNSLMTIIQDSIRLGGDMEEPFTPWDNFTGGYIPYFKVYDREGEPCKVCTKPIVREEVGGRNAFFCTNCQK